MFSPGVVVKRGNQTPIWMNISSLYPMQAETCDKIITLLFKISLQVIQRSCPVKKPCLSILNPEAFCLTRQKEEKQYRVGKYFQSQSFICVLMCNCVCTGGKKLILFGK